MDWTRWTVILLKPDCLARGLVGPVLAQVATRVALVDQRTVTATEAQILAHYQDLLTTRRHQFTGVDVVAELRRIYLGHPAGIALGYGPDAARRVRNLLGHYDPALAAPDTIRGRYGSNALDQARAQRRLVDNLIHSSDHPAGARREFGIWYRPGARHLLHHPRPRHDTEVTCP